MASPPACRMHRERLERERLEQGCEQRACQKERRGGATRPTARNGGAGPRLRILLRRRHRWPTRARAADLAPEPSLTRVSWEARAVVTLPPCTHRLSQAP